MKRAFKDDVYNVTVKWSKPKPYDQALEALNKTTKDVYFYKIIANYKKSYKLLYIGMTYSQYVAQRLSNKDHIKKREALQNIYKRQQLLVSFGHVTTDRKINSRLIEEIESLLIYTHSDISCLTNIKSKWSHQITRDYLITNKGFREDEMVKKIGLGLFFKW